MSEKAVAIIRRATMSDTALLAELGSRTFSDTFAADNNPEDMAVYLAASFSREQLTAELADPLSRILIAEVNKSAVGYALLHAGEPLAGVSNQKPIELVRFYVSQEWHGLGVGETLMKACIDTARHEDYRTIWLGVWEHNGRARAFYRKWKFQDVGEHIFQLGSDLQNDILMERRL